MESDRKEIELGQEPRHPFDFVRTPVTPLEEVLAPGGQLPGRVVVEQVHKEIIGQCLGPIGKDSNGRLTSVRIQDTHAANENSHLWGGQRQQVRSIHKLLFHRPRMLSSDIVAEPIRGRLKHGK